MQKDRCLAQLPSYVPLELLHGALHFVQDEQGCPLLSHLISNVLVSAQSQTMKLHSRTCER